MNNWLGCRKCPQFTETPDLRIRDEVAFELDQAYFGSFSARGANEAVLSFSGCEVRSAGMGGVVFARFEAGQWRMVSYRAGPMRDCERTDQQGRTLFLCRPGSAWQGYMDENVVVQDYGNPGPHFLFNLADNTGTACFPEPRDGVYYSGQISAVGWLDLNHDGWRDVAATISFSSELWNTAPTEDACSHEADLMSDRLQSSATRSLLEFISTGTDFRPTPSTQRILADIERQAKAGPAPPASRRAP